MNTPFIELIDAWLTDALTPREEEAFIIMLEDKANYDILERVIAEKAEAQSLIGQEDVNRREKSLLALQQKLEVLNKELPAVPLIRPLYKRIWAAAVVLLVLAAGIYFLIPAGRQKHLVALPPVARPSDIAPGRNGAILTLSDGSAIVLDSVKDGLVANQNGAKIMLQQDALTYASSGRKTGEATLNMISTPRGRQFKVVLPDGTKVWLNAASSVRYPTAFGGRERRVTVTGEAYFEVAENAQAPFYVGINRETEIQVLGTDFNINAYGDEPVIKTTLLAGSVKIVRGNRASILKPGEEAAVHTINASNTTISIQPADIEKVVAWKKGIFDMEGEGTATFMRQLSRWYDLEIVYNGPVPERKFHGKLGRDLQLSQILDVLSQFNIRYQLTGKVLTIE